IGNQLRARLRPAVGIFSAQRVVLPVAPGPFDVAVALIASDDDADAHAGAVPRAFEHVHRAHGVRFEGGDRVAVRSPDQRLRGQVEDYLRTELVEHPGQPLTVAQVALIVAQALAEGEYFEVRRVCRNVQGASRHLRTQLQQPRAQPGTLAPRAP